MAAAFNLTAQINLQGPGNLKPIVSKIKKELGSIKTNLNLDVKPGTAKNIGQITRSLNTLSKAAINANTNIAALNGTLSSLASSFNNASGSTSAALNGFNSVSKSAKGSTKAIAETRTAIEEFGKQSGLAIKRFAAFSTVSTVIYGVVNALTSGYKEFLTFNQEIVRLSQVTNKSVSDLKGVTDEITRLSTGLGVASSDLLIVTTTLAQAGFTAEETKIALEALAKSALAPSFENLASTTEGAIAAMRQFGIQASELDDALGSINAVAAAFAVEAGDIIAAIQRTGGVFASASKGVSEGTDSLNEFIAVFTSIRATTRESAETIATGLRTIFTRIQRSSTIQLLKDYGVELRDLEGKFVGPYEAVKRLSEGLNKIDPRSSAFAAISEELGGFRQIGKVIPLLQQFGVAQDALNVAQRGQKSLAKDAIAAQQSLAVQFTKTRESFLALIRDIGETGTFKAFVGTTLTLTNALITLGGALKPILPLLLTFTAIKLGSSLKQYSSGFLGAFGGGGGAAGGGGIPNGGGGGTGGGGGSASKAAALVTNTTALTTLNTSILALNQNIVNTNSLLMNRPAGGKFASGGLVPGSGNSDTYRAMLTPGEFVIRKKAVEKIGAENLARMNSGGIIRKYGVGSPGTTGVEEISDAEILQKFFKNQFDPQQNIIRGKMIAGKPVIVTAASIRNRKLETLSKSSGLPLKSLEEAKVALLQKSQTSAKEAQRLRVAEKLEKRSAIKENRVLDFGLVGLRYGSSAKDIDTMTTFDAGKPKGFEEKKYNINKATDSSNAFIRIRAATVSEKLKNTEAEKIQNLILDSFKNSVVMTAQNMASFIPNGTIDKSQLDATVQNSDFYNVIGAALESSLGLLGAPLVQKTEKTKSIDFPAGLGASAQIFGSAFENIPTDVTRTIGGEGKGIARYKEQIVRWLATDAGQKYLSKFPNVKFAQGGSTEDSVHALLTPGEFVFNKKAAQRIGYGTLNKLNKADKLPGFNKGGAVGNIQRFAAGGQAQDQGVDKAAVVAAVTSILLPEVQKLASSFGKLEGSAAEAGAALGGIIREASSMLLSAGISLSAVGANKKVTALAQTGTFIAGGLSGALTDGTGKALEKVLLKNTELLGKFGKELEDFKNAPTEELRLESSKRLEEAFFKLDNVVRASVPSMESLERWNLIGKSIGSLNSTILTITTAMVAVRVAAFDMARSFRASAVSAQTAAAAQRARQGAGLALGLTKAVPYIGLILTALSVGYEIFSFFNTSLKSASEQLNKVSDALEEVTKNSKDFSLNNARYSEKVLSEFEKRSNKVRALGVPENVFRREIGEFNIGNELNLLFREQLKSALSAVGIGIRPEQTIKEVLDKLTPRQREDFERVRVANEEALIIDLFKRAKRSEGITDEEALNKLLKDLGGPANEAVKSIAKEYAGRFSQIKESADLLTKAQNSLRTSLLSLNNVLNLTALSFQKIVTTTEERFNDLDRTINIIAGKEPTFVGGEFYKRDVATLENLTMASTEEIDSLLKRARTNIGVGRTIGQPQDQQQIIEQEKLVNQLEGQLKGLAIMQRSAGGIMTRLATQQDMSSDTITTALEENLGYGLRSALKETTGGQEIADKLLREMAASIEKARSGQDGAKLGNLEDIAPTVIELQEKIKTGGESLKKIFEFTGKAAELLMDQHKKLYESEQELLNFRIQQRQLESDNNIALKRAMGQYVTLGELNAGFMAEMKLLTSSIKTPIRSLRGFPQMMSGTMNPDVIFQALQSAKTEQQRLVDKLKENPSLPEQNDINKELRKQNNIITNLNKALLKLNDSGSRLKDTLDKISESESFDKNKRNILFDLITGAGDPAKMLQFQQNFVGLDVLLKGAQGEGIGVGQAPMAAEGLQLANQLFPPEIVNQLQKDFLISFVKNNKQFGDETSRTKILELLEKGSPITQAYKAQAEQIVKSTERVGELLPLPLIESINTRAKNLDNIFGYLATSLQNSFPGVVKFLEDVKNQRLPLETNKFKRPEIEPKLIEKIRDSVRALGTTTRDIVMMGPEGPTFTRVEEKGPLSKTQVNELLGQPGFRTDTDLQSLVNAIQTVANTMSGNRGQNSISQSIFGGGFVSDETIDAARAKFLESVATGAGEVARILQEKQKQDRAFFKEEERVRAENEKTRRSGIPEPRNSGFPAQTAPPVSTPFGGRGALLNPTAPAPIKLDTSSFESGVTGFDRTVDKMVKAFAPDGGVTKLSVAVESLGTVANNLMNAVNELQKTIPNGIVKVEQNIKSEVDVSIPGGVDINASRTQLAQSDVDKLGASIVGSIKSGIGSMFGLAAKG